MNHPPPIATYSPDRPALPYIGKVAAAISTYEAVMALGVKVRNRWRGRSEYVTSIDSADDMYGVVLAAVLDRLPAEHRRSIAMHTGRSDYAVPVAEGMTSERRAVSWRYDGARSASLQLGRHRIAVNLTDEQRGSAGERIWRDRQVVFVSPNAAARDALHDWLVNLVTEVRQTRPAMRIASVWGHWEHRGDIPHRTLDTVVLDGNQKQELVDDVEQFLADEAAYARLGVPWHRGYLLYGPPGTGKTSLAKALACHFGLGLFYVPLADMRGDADLLRLVTDVPPRSILLLEDIDVNTAATAGTDDTARASMSALLNALDGAFTPHGLIKILTTNERRKLDERVIRPGRVGLELELGLCTADQVDGLWQLAYGWHAPVQLRGDIAHAVGHSPGEVVDVLRRNLDDARAAAAEFATWQPSTVPHDAARAAGS